MIVFPIAYFGSIAYYQEIARHEAIRIEAKEHFPKQTYRNRCDIVGSDGILSLSIPTKKKNGSKTATEDILLSNDENWRIRHWRAINSAYHSAPFFDYYGIEVKELLLNDEQNFLTYQLNITKRILSWLDLEIKINSTEEFYPMKENDFRTDLVGKNNFQEISPAPYIQVFPGENNYKKSLSILDAIFCEGPMARNLITNSTKK